MNNALAYLGGFLAVVFAALFAVPTLIDWNGYRGVFEEEASKLLGRDVRVGGAVNLRLLPTPYVKFEKVRLADVSGQTGEPFIRVDNFMMRLSGPALLRGVLEATEIELNKPVLTLALDGAGGGNWSSIKLQGGALPFAPRDVTLRSVKLIDGVVSLYSPQSAVIAKIERINGELSADALRGPFRFKGEASWSGVARDIRFATTEMSSDSSFRLKAASRAVVSGNAFTLDALFDDVAQNPKISGELTGQIFMPGAPAPVPAAGATVAPGEAPALDLKSTLTADARGASLSDITLTLQSAAEPQIITGKAGADWSDAPRIELALNSKWLDLDRWAGAGADNAPLQKISQLALGVVEAATGDGTAVAKIDVEQLKIGGETTGGLKIDAERKNGAVRLKELRAGLPGGARLGLAGDIKTGEGGAATFAGDAFISGTSLARLKSWLEKSGAKIDVGPDGVFTAEGKVKIGNRRFEVTQGSAQVGGRTMTGEIKIIEEGRRRAEITIESAQLERSDLFPETTKALETAVLRALGVASGADAASVPSSGATPVKTDMDISLRVLAGELKRGGDIYRDVDATVALENGNVRIRSAKFATAAGLSVSIEGRIDDKDGAPLGAISFDAKAPTAPAMRDLVGIFGLNEVIAPEHADSLGSANLAGLLRLGSRTPAAADISVDGVIGGSTVSVHGAFDAGLGRWRLDPSQVRIAVSAPALSNLASVMTGKGVSPTSPPRESTLILTTAGVLATGASARIDVTAEDLDAGFEGALAWAHGAPMDVGGRLKVKASEISDALSLAGFAPAGRLAPIPINGSIDIARKDGVWSLQSENLALGASSLKGGLSIASGDGGLTSINGELAADVVDVRGLLAPIVDAASAQTPAQPSEGEAAAVEESPVAPPWPDGSFKMAAIETFTGEVVLTFSRLVIGDGLQVRSGRLTALKSPGKLEFKGLSGEAAGGQLSGDVALEASAAGVKGMTEIAIRELDLAALGASNAGKANLRIEASGQALSPKALIASLAGEGKLQLKGARIVAPSHQAARSVVDSVLQKKTENDIAAVSAALNDELTKSIVDLGDRDIDLRIVNGVIANAPLTLEDDAGATSAGASLDIGTWSIASVWKVAPRPSPLSSSAPAKGPLPPVSIAFNGRLDDLAGLAPTIEATALQRELVVRQMERNVEELERLRQGDEERVLLERERRKLIEEEKARAAAEAAARSAAEQAAPPNDAVEPTPPNATAAPQSDAGPAAVSPDAESGPAAATNGEPVLSEQPKPAYRPRPPRPRESRRTSSDEVMRSLGGYP